MLIITILLALAAFFCLGMAIVRARAELAAHAAEVASKHVPAPTPYTGPLYSVRGGEINRR